jgi:hypothetical protein
LRIVSNMAISCLTPCEQSHPGGLATIRPQHAVIIGLKASFAVTKYSTFGVGMVVYPDWQNYRGALINSVEMYSDVNPASFVHQTGNCTDVGRMPNTMWKMGRRQLPGLCLQNEMHDGRRSQHGGPVVKVNERSGVSSETRILLKYSPCSCVIPSLLVRATEALDT